MVISSAVRLYSLVVRGALMRGHHLRIPEQAAILHIGCDARCSKRMATGGHVEPCVLCAAAIYAEYVNPAKATRCQVPQRPRVERALQRR